MKKYIIPFLLFISLLTTSCEEVVKVDLDTAPEKLVIDANLYFDVNQPNAPQKIKLSKTVAYYASEFSPTLGAKVWIDDDLGNRFEFLDANQDGIYENNLLQLNLSATYELFVEAEGQTYNSTTTFYDTPEITEIEQKTDGGFLGDSYEFKIWFQDNAQQENFYQLIDNLENKIEFSVKDDSFSNGNLMNFTLSDSDIEQGQSFEISFSEISKPYFEYMQKILATSQNAGNPFASPIGEIRGNIINQNNVDNYPLGFFSLHKTINKVIVAQ